MITMALHTWSSECHETRCLQVGKRQSIMDFSLAIANKEKKTGLVRIGYEVGSER